MNPETIAGSSFDEKCRFIEALVDASQLYGVSSRSMAGSLSEVVNSLGLKGTLLATPNYVQTILWEEDENQQKTHLAISRSGNYNLAKLAAITELSDQVRTGEVHPSDGLKGLRKIAREPNEYGALANAFAFIGCGASFAIIMGGSWLDVLFSGLLSLVPFVVTRIAARSAGLTVVQELVAAMFAAILASAVSTALAGSSAPVIAVCSIILFVPGFGLTIAPSELVGGNTLSGIIWLTNASVIALKLFGGFAIGFSLALGHWPQAGSSSVSAGIPRIWVWVAIPVFLVAIATSLQARARTFPGIVIGGLLVWATVQFGNTLDYWQGTFLGAAVLTFYGHWYGLKFRVPSTAILLPCVMILLPGVAALRALYDLNTLGIAAGFAAASRVLVLVSAIVGGTIAGDAMRFISIARTARALKALVGDFTE